MKYVYYEPATMQVMALFDTPHLGVQQNWVDKEYVRAPIADDVTFNRDRKITRLDAQGVVVSTEASMNPEQPLPRVRTRLDDLRDKLADDSITDVEIREMLKLERGL